MKIIDECDEELQNYGFLCKTLEYGINHNFLHVKTKQQQKRMGWEKGEYHVVNCPNLYLYNTRMLEYLKNTLAEIVEGLLEKILPANKVLIVGIGNRDIACDSFGVEVACKVFCCGNTKNNLISRQVFSLCPMVQSQSGIVTSHLVEMCAKQLGVDLIILIDSLMTSNINRLAHSFQISSSGLTPGGAVGKKQSINKTTTNINTLSIGVPFMVDLCELCDSIEKSIIVSPKDIKKNIDKTSDVVAEVINKVLYPNLSVQEIHELKTW